jgi:hypothetical protein
MPDSADRLFAAQPMDRAIPGLDPQANGGPFGTQKR